MIYQSQGDRPRAEACFHKTVYLDPNHDDALLALALSAERRGEHKVAEGYRRRAARIAAVTANKAN
jgi:chemotaxis protein methyltransferase WspC